MSTAKRLVWSLRGRKNSDSNPATSSTHLVASGILPAHELDEVAIVPSPNRNAENSATQLPHFNYGMGMGLVGGSGSGGIADVNLNDLMRRSTGKFIIHPGYNISFVSFLISRLEQNVGIIV